MASPEITALLAPPPEPQGDSPLFRIPTEIRYMIYKFALEDYPNPDPEVRFSESTYYTRPDYSAPRMSSTTLLCTCRQVFRECWNMAFPLREQIHWTDWNHGIPPGYSYWEKYGEFESRSLTSLRKRRNLDPKPRWNERLAQQLSNAVSQRGGLKVEIENLTLYAEMSKLEQGKLCDILSTPHLNPKRITLNIRHQDWWHWETDARLSLEGFPWLEAAKVMSSNVREVTIKLESLSRKKDQVIEIAKQMRQQWFLRRKDKLPLFADNTGKSDEVSTWSGTSVWEGQRWVRDETAPGRLKYYVHAVTFRTALDIEKRGGMISEEAEGCSCLDRVPFGQFYLEATSAEPLQGLGAINVGCNGRWTDQRPSMNPDWAQMEEGDGDDKAVPGYDSVYDVEGPDEIRKTKGSLFYLMSWLEVETVCDYATVSDYEEWWYDDFPGGVPEGRPAPLSWWYAKRKAILGR